MKGTKSKTLIVGRVRSGFLMAPPSENIGPLVANCYWTVTVTYVVCRIAPEVPIT
jgi:hypothetical protein